MTTVTIYYIVPLILFLGNTLQNVLSVVNVQEVNVDTLVYGIDNGDFKMHSDIYEAIHQFTQDSDRL